MCVTVTAFFAHSQCLSAYFGRTIFFTARFSPVLSDDYQPSWTYGAHGRERVVRVQGNSNNLVKSRCICRHSKGLLPRRFLADNSRHVLSLNLL